MTHPQSALLFPYYHIPALADLRGPQWQQLVHRVSALPEDNEETLSLCLLVIELCDCMNCDVNSYKASLGCRTCARRFVAGHKGSDLTLQRQFEHIKSRFRAARAGQNVKPLLASSSKAAEADTSDQEQETDPPRRRRSKRRAESPDT